MRQGLSLYFVRHGQTGWNHARRIQGQLDTELNETGRAQAAGNGERLATLRADIASLDFIASPMLRCRETMEIIRGKLDLDRHTYTTDDRLKEIHFGTWQGRHWPDVATLDPDGAAARLDDPFNWRPPEGESYADLTRRCAEWLATVERDTVVDAHGGVSRALRGHIYDLAPSEITELKVPQDKILVLRADQMAWA